MIIGPKLMNTLNNEILEYLVEVWWLINSGADLNFKTGNF